MKKTVVLVLVLIVVFSSQLFSETLDCQQSFELGKADAKEEHRFWAWYVLGIGTAVAAPFVVTLVSTMLTDDDTDSGYESGPITAIVVLSIPVISAFLSPRRETISSSSGGVELECYRDGYKRRASWKNCGALLLGGLTVFAGVFVGGFVMYMAGG